MSSRRWAARGRSETATRSPGRWAFTSGCRHADPLAFGCLVEASDRGPPAHRMAVVTREDALIHDTWDVAGLCATGSHDVELRDARVPRARMTAIIGARARHPGPLYAFPLFGLLAVGISSVALGTARGALEELIELAASKRPQASGRRLAERPNVQAAVAEADARLRGARAFVGEAIAQAWDEAVRHGELSVEARVTVRLAATHATDVAAQVTERAYRLGGGSALYRSSPLQRRFRDVHAATQHMMVSPATLKLAGKALLGLEVDASQL